MLCTHVGLYSYLPLSLEGPKGEGVRVPRWGWGQCPPKSDTNPLTRPEHPCYYPHRSNTNPTISRRNHNTGGTPAPAHTRTQRPSPSQRAAHTLPLGSSERRHLLIPKAQAHLPPPRRWKAHRLSSASPVQRRLCRFNAPHHRVRLPRPIARRFSR